MTKAEREKLIEKQMKILGCTREEAIEIVSEDEEIDHMTMKQLNADLTPEQKQAMKKAKATGERKTKPNYKFETKAKPKDAEKVEILQKIFGFVATFTENCVIFNEGKEITFNYGENQYSLSLTKHRKPKE